MGPAPAPAGTASAAASGAAGCTLIDGTLLAETGAVSVLLENGDVAIRSARSVQGARLWTR
jgi:hypothetical protein